MEIAALTSGRIRSKVLAGAVFVLSALAATTAYATPIVVTFTANGGFVGQFRYDDAAPLAVPAGVPYFQGGTSYDAISFTVNGNPQAGPFYVELYDNFNATTTDYIYFTGSLATGPLIQLSGTGAITGTGLAQLTGTTLANYNSPTLNDFYPGPYTGLDQPGSFNLTSLTINAETGTAAVPEPASISLVVLGLAGLAHRLRRRSR